METGFSHVLVILSQDGIFALGSLRSVIKRQQNRTTAFDLVICTQGLIMFELPCFRRMCVND